jgi:hypothetical protein
MKDKIRINGLEFYVDAALIGEIIESGQKIEEEKEHLRLHGPKT